MPAEHGLVGTGRAACQTYTECPLKRWQLSAQSPLCSLWPCLPPPTTLPSTELGKLRYTIGNLHSRGEVGATLPSWSRKGPWLIDLRTGPWALWQALVPPPFLVPSFSLLVATVRTLSRTLGRKVKAAPPLGEEGWTASSAPLDEVWELRAGSGPLEKLPAVAPFLCSITLGLLALHTWQTKERVLGGWSSLFAPGAP